MLLQKCKGSLLNIVGHMNFYGMSWSTSEMCVKGQKVIWMILMIWLIWNFSVKSGDQFKSPSFFLITATFDIREGQTLEY